MVTTVSQSSTFIHRHWLTTVVIALGTWHVLATMLNHDVAYYLLLAGALDQGRELYSTYPDYGLPANAWLASLSLRLSELLAAPVVPTHQLLLLLATVPASLLAAARLGRLIGRGTPEASVLAPVLVGLTLFLPGYDFGQRDFLFAVMSLPLLAVVTERHLGSRPPLTTSVAAVVLVTICGSLKPQFGLPLLVLAMVDALLRRSLRVAPEIAAAGVVLLGYIGLVHWLYPEYFTEILPKAFAVYATYSGQMSQVVATHLAIATVALALAAVAGVLLVRREKQRQRSATILAAWAVVALSLLALFLQQGQGFNYHLLPFSMFAFASLATLCLALGSRTLALPSSSLRSGALHFLVLVGSIVAFCIEPEWTRRDALKDEFTQALLELEPGTPVLVLSTGVPPQSPLLAYADVRWTGAFGSLDEVAAIVNDRKEAESAGRPRAPELVASEEDLRRRVLLSMTQPQPEVVFVDVSVPLRWFERRHRQFELVKFMQEDPAFAELWVAYEEQHELKTIYDLRLRPYRLKKAQRAPVFGQERE